MLSLFFGFLFFHLDGCIPVICFCHSARFSWIYSKATEFNRPSRVLLPDHTVHAWSSLLFVIGWVDDNRKPAQLPVTRCLSTQKGNYHGYYIKSSLDQLADVFFCPNKSKYNKRSAKKLNLLEGNQKNTLSKTWLKFWKQFITNFSLQNKWNF